jgi:hypothetical protein
MNQIKYYIIKGILIFAGMMAHAQELWKMPAEIDGWALSEVKTIDTREALYDYIDGGAELYISYGFKRAMSYRFTLEGQPDVTAEIFDLGTAENAFGVYGQTRDKEEKAFGQGSYYVSGALFFWKGKYWISLITGETTDASEKLLYRLAAIIDAEITETGDIHPLVSMLPAEGLVAGGYLYFHHYIWLNSYYFISSENILGINDNTPSVLAKYGPADERLYLLMVQYPDKTLAEKAFAAFGKHYFPEGLTEDCLMLEDNTWMAAGLQEEVLIGVFNGTKQETVKSLLNRVRNKL